MVGIMTVSRVAMACCRMMGWQGKSVDSVQSAGHTLGAVLKCVSSRRAVRVVFERALLRARMPHDRPQGLLPSTDGIALA